MIPHISWDSRAGLDHPAVRRAHLSPPYNSTSRPAAKTEIDALHSKANKYAVVSLLCHLACITALVFAANTHAAAWWVTVGFTYFIAWRSTIHCANIGGIHAVLSNAYKRRPPGTDQ